MKREDLERKKQILIQYETSQEQFDKTMLNLSNTISRAMLQPQIPQYIPKSVSLKHSLHS